MTTHPITTAIYNEVNENFLKSHGTIRWGQTLWNTAEDCINKHCSVDVIERLQGLKNTEWDCYYSDIKVKNFVQALDRIFEETKQVKNNYN